MTFRKVLTFILCCIIQQGISQIYYFDNYTVKDGLSQSNVYAIHQDSLGYLWLGTGSGISRFDGTEFVNYSTLDSTAGNGVRTICEDNEGILWFGHTGGGITRRTNDAFHTIKFDSLDINCDISKIAQDLNGNIWIATTEQGALYITSTEGDISEWEITNFKGLEGLSDRVFDIIVGTDSSVYFITDVGVKIYEGKSEKDPFITYAPEGLPVYFQVTTMYFDNAGNVWYGTYNGGLYRQRFDGRGFDIYDVRDGLAHNWISKITEDKKGHIWIGTWGGGLSRFDGKKLLTFNQYNGLNDLKIRDIEVDQEGNVIIGTNEHGIEIFKGERFISYTEEIGLSGNQVWAVNEDKNGRLWLGTSSGLTMFDPNSASKEFQYLNVEDHFFISDNIRFIKRDLNGKMWVGTDQGVVSMDDRASRSSITYSPLINGNISLHIVTGMDVDKFNNLWIGTLDGLVYYEIDRNAIDVLTQRNGLNGNDVSVVFCDNKGDVWVGCRGNGLTKISGTTFKSINIGSEITPNAITQDKNGSIWVGTDGQGLIKLENDTVSAHFGVEDGLNTPLITSLQADDNGNIWIGTNNGISRYHEKSGFSTYSEKDGFTGIEAKFGASYKDAKGNIWFGTVKGVVRYSPSHDVGDEHKPSILITRFRVNLKDNSILESGEFKYKENSMRFDFKGIFLTNPTKVYYRVQLEGIDEDWSPPSKTNFASYPALPAGSYTFKVQASKQIDEWDVQTATYEFVIEPPFWKTWWFYLFCLIVISSWVAFFIKRREEQLVMEKKILEDKVAERTAEIADKNKELASKNKDITDSIRYAERIQRAVLPPDELVKKSLPDSFVFFRPKDIVSGDFYWVYNKNEKILYSAADCTGHGVPGAFMSIIGHNSLDKIVGEMEITTPSLILDELNQSVSTTLRQKSEMDQVKDGMDMALISVDTEKKTIEYAGAHNPLYIIRNDELIETKANKFAIGSFIRGEKQKFENHTFEAMSGDTIYAFSDGFPDQFGGENGKKYKYRPFKNFLMSIHKEPMHVQHQKLEDEFISWLGSYEQIDDVLIIGVKIP